MTDVGSGEGGLGERRHYCQGGEVEASTAKPSSATGLIKTTCEMVLSRLPPRAACISGLRFSLPRAPDSKAGLSPSETADSRKQTFSLSTVIDTPPPCQLRGPGRSITRAAFVKSRDGC